MQNDIFEVTKTLNNIKNHDFSVANYKMCKEEANYCIKALELLKKSLEFDNIQPIGAENETSI